MLYNKLAVLTALLAMVYGAPSASKPSPGVFELPLNKVRQDGPEANLTRRALTQEQLGYTGIRYYANYTIGGQTQTGVLDSGSSDIWTFSNQVWSGGYNPGESSTYNKLNDNFVDAYGNGNSKVEGTWATDTIGLGGAEVPNFQFAYTNESNAVFSDNIGLFAIGPKDGESVHPKYPTFFESLRNNGVIQSNSFSLYNDVSNTEATLILGGIDTAKFQAPLYTLGLDTTELYGEKYYTVNFEFQGVTYSGGLLDTGTQSILLPQNVADSVAEEYGATYDPRGGYLRSSPPAANQPGLDFQIGGVNITVPAEDLWVQVGDLWVFGINRNVNFGAYEYNTLGDPILKQLFLFFDVDKNQVAFAPVVRTDESNLVPVGDTIPGSVPAPNQKEGGGSGSGPQCIIC